MPDRRPRGALGRLFSLGASIALLAGLAPATAGSRTTGDLLELPFEDLLQVEIRSAGKREEQIRDIPASVTILTREDIARYGWITLSGLVLFAVLARVVVAE